MERIPILRMGSFLLVTIQVDMHDRLALTLQDDLTNRIAATGARGVLLDISALEIVDSFIESGNRPEWMILTQVPPRSTSPLPFRPTNRRWCSVAQLRRARTCTRLTSRATVAYGA